MRTDAQAMANAHLTVDCVHVISNGVEMNDAPLAPMALVEHDVSQCARPVAFTGDAPVLPAFVAAMNIGLVKIAVLQCTNAASMELGISTTMQESSSHLTRKMRVT